MLNESMKESINQYGLIIDRGLESPSFCYAPPKKRKWITKVFYPNPEKQYHRNKIISKIMEFLGLNPDIK